MTSIGFADGRDITYYSGTIIIAIIVVVVVVLVVFEKGGINPRGSRWGDWWSWAGDARYAGDGAGS